MGFLNNELIKMHINGYYAEGNVFIEFVKNKKFS